MHVNLLFKKIAVLIPCLLLAAALNAQTVTKAFRSVPLKTVLEEVERQTGYSILFENEDVDVSSPVTATFKDATLRTVLDTVLDKSLRYTVKGGGETGHHLPAFAGLRSGGPERGTDRLRHGHLLGRQPAHRRGQHLR
mgnify:CR=1 FL=1